MGAHGPARAGDNERLLQPSERQTFCPYKGLCSYYDAGGVTRAAWSYREPYREVDRIGDMVSFEPDRVTVTIDGEQLTRRRVSRWCPMGQTAASPRMRS
jgi:uncharacterized protein (DUF427 family)